MAALRDIARDFAAEIRDGIGWTIVYRTGRSWNALTIWSDIWNGEWETNDLNDAIGILKADPDAVIVNGEERAVDWDGAPDLPVVLALAGHVEREVGDRLDHRLHFAADHLGSPLLVGSGCGSWCRARL